MVVTPAATPVATFPETVAVAGLEDVHVTSGVQSAVDVVVPLVNVPRAENVSFAPTASVGPLGEMASDCRASRSTAPFEVCVVSEVKVAVTCAFCGVGSELGAVYRPELLMLPLPEVTAQVTAVWAELVTVTENC